MIKKISLSLFILGLSLMFHNVAQAHRSGCHRWHSCPSDTGSYVCGDLGYTSGCPTYAKPQPVVPPPPKIVPPPAAQPPASIQRDTTESVAENPAPVSNVTTQGYKTEDDMSLGDSLAVIATVIGGFGLYVWYRRRKTKSSRHGDH